MFKKGVFLEKLNKLKNYPLGHNAAKFVENHPTFQRDLPPPSSGYNIKPNKVPAQKKR
jgi:hypothetical protein